MLSFTLLLLILLLAFSLGKWALKFKPWIWILGPSFACCPTSYKSYPFTDTSFPYLLNGEKSPLTCNIGRIAWKLSHKEFCLACNRHSKYGHIIRKVLLLGDRMQIHGVCVTASLKVPVADIGNQPSACSCSALMWLQNNPPSSPRQPISSHWRCWGVDPLCYPFHKNKWKGQRGPKKSLGDPWGHTALRWQSCPNALATVIKNSSEVWHEEVWNGVPHLYHSVTLTSASSLVKGRMRCSLSKL